MLKKSCAFFGHRNMNIEPYREKLFDITVDLIENYGVEQFYSGFRGDFDFYCSNLIHDLKVRYFEQDSHDIFEYKFIFLIFGARLGHTF